MTHRLPTMLDAKDYVETGGLMSHSPNYDDLYRRGAIYVDKILKGSKPADLPVEQATKFELVISLGTAKALGLTSQRCWRGRMKSFSKSDMSPWPTIAEVAKQFFEACEGGKGWEDCRQYCKPGATFSAQAEPLADVRSLQQYTDWMKNVCAYGVFMGTHTGAGGACPPTGKSVKTDYVYVMDFDGDRIRHMTKIWHSGLAVKELRWA